MYEVMEFKGNTIAKYREDARSWLKMINKPSPNMDVLLSYALTSNALVSYSINDCGYL